LKLFLSSCGVWLLVFIRDKFLIGGVNNGDVVPGGDSWDVMTVEAVDMPDCVELKRRGGVT